MKINLFVEAIGTATSLGIGTEEAIKGLKNKPNIHYFKFNNEAVIPISQVSKYLNKPSEEKVFNFAEEALNNIVKKINIPLKSLLKTALLIGCTKGDSFGISKTLFEKNPDYQTFLIASSNLINQKLSQKYELPFIPVSSAACATGAQVLQKAGLLLKKDYEKIILCMTEASLTPVMMGAFSQLGVLTKNKAGTAPFEEKHSGFHMGEGAVALLLSKKGSSDNEGEIMGTATSTDAEHFTTFPNGPIMVWETIQALCKTCSVKISDINHVNLHGTGTLANDTMEKSLANLMIKENPQISFSALKPYTGHLLGASGLSEFALTLLMAQNNWIAPLLNGELTQNTLPDNFIREPQGRSKNIQYFLTLSYGLGSTIGVILGKK